MYASPSPKPAAGPVTGLMNPILRTSASCLRAVAQTGSAPAPATTRPPTVAPARFTNCRREIAASSLLGSVIDPPSSRPVRPGEYTVARMTGETMELYDLRVTVERIEGRSVCGLEVGDYFE